MIEKIRGIVMVSMLASMVYLPGYLSHISLHLSHSDDYVSIRGNNVWRYLLGVKRTEKIYIRPALVQGLGILYLILGVGGMLLFGMPMVELLTAWVLAGGLTVFGIVSVGIDIWKRLCG